MSSPPRRPVRRGRLRLVTDQPASTRDAGRTRPRWEEDDPEDLDWTGPDRPAAGGRGPDRGVGREQRRRTRGAGGGRPGRPSARRSGRRGRVDRLDPGRPGAGTGYDDGYGEGYGDGYDEGYDDLGYQDPFDDDSYSDRDHRRGRGGFRDGDLRDGGLHEDGLHEDLRYAGLRYGDPDEDELLPDGYDPADDPGRGEGPRRAGRPVAGRAPSGRLVTRAGAGRPAARAPWVRARERSARLRRAQAARRPRRLYRLGSPRRRLRVCVVLMTAALVILAGRLAQLQGFAASAYAEQARRQLQRTIELPAARGVITDRHGNRLAQDVERRAVYADPMLVEDPAEAARLLAPVLGHSERALREAMTTDPEDRIRFVYLARDLDTSVGDEVKALGLAGIGVLEERRRNYPSKTLAANIVGYTKLGEKDVIIGQGGLELAYDELLRGTNGIRRLEADPSGREIPSAQSMEKAPVSGSTLRLTIDRDIQWEAQNAIAEAVRTSEADGGTVVVMDPETGDILAMADAPQFDPNHITDRDLDALKNRATADTFEPGSVNKVITMAAALERGLIDVDTEFTIPPAIERGGERIRDSSPHGTLHLTAAGVLARSSNIGTVLVAERVGNDGLERTLRAFGLGRVSELDFPGEQAGILPPASKWSASQAATISYGQGMSATAIQMASVYATIANGGVRVAPRLVDAIISPDGTETVLERHPERRVISERTAAALTRMLETVATSEGTAPAAEVPGYRVAGKTGTAYRPDTVNGGYQGYVSSFIGFAPADDPKVVVEVVLDNPRKGYYGGQVAAPVFARVMSFALNTLGVPPPGTAPEPLVLELDRPEQREERAAGE